MLRFLFFRYSVQFLHTCAQSSDYLVLGNVLFSTNNASVHEIRLASNVTFGMFCRILDL